jgi:predicted DNA-binding ribbon-helix-helix protein
LEAEFWQYIREIAFERKVTQGHLISVINRCKRKGFSLASAIRVFVAQHYRGDNHPRL